MNRKETLATIVIALALAVLAVLALALAGRVPWWEVSERPSAAEFIRESVPTRGLTQCPPIGPHPPGVCYTPSPIPPTAGPSPTPVPTDTPQPTATSWAYPPPYP